MIQRVLIGLAAVLILGGACTAGGTTSPRQPGVPDVLDWDHSPDAVIVRIDTIGGLGLTGGERNRIPFCTLYGDGHVIWVDPYADPEQVLEDRITADGMHEFLRQIINAGFFNWQSSTRPTFGEGPLLDRITVTLYGTTHAVDGMSNWPPGAFDSILTRCRTLSSAPVLYLPSGAWMSAVSVVRQPDAPGIPWDTFAEAFPDVNLPALSLEHPRWVTGDLLEAMWRLARSGRAQILLNGNAYQIVLQVPNLQAEAPPAPH